MWNTFIIVEQSVKAFTVAVSENKFRANGLTFKTISPLMARYYSCVICDHTRDSLVPVTRIRTHLIPVTRAQMHLIRHTSTFDIHYLKRSQCSYHQVYG
ncbi:hypothetical protein PoB_001915300 [Plakobranchus ocellatus]|uniref:Uncharacterized protein n=1 Tax=Plakobranchus ocellatus TaxID=259542 RepID=A0AAV3ZDW8_9GAST|nr:hypothetical protein PoB_001915300 [Plakobranchus ocellatus]